MAAKGPTIQWVRGDSAPKTMNLTQGGSAFDLTGFTNLEIVVNSEDEPATTTNEQFRQPVTINAPATDGSIDFQPVGGDVATRKTNAEAYVPGEYFYDLQADDGAGERVTLFLAGNYNVLQDINKS